MSESERLDIEIRSRGVEETATAIERIGTSGTKSFGEVEKGARLSSAEFTSLTKNAAQLQAQLGTLETQTKASAARAAASIAQEQARIARAERRATTGSGILFDPLPAKRDSSALAQVKAESDKANVEGTRTAPIFVNDNFVKGTTEATSAAGKLADAVDRGGRSLGQRFRTLNSAVSLTKGILFGSGLGLFGAAIKGAAELGDKIDRARLNLEKFGKLGSNGDALIGSVETAAKSVGLSLDELSPALQRLQDNQSKTTDAFGKLGTSARNNTKFVAEFVKALQAGGANGDETKSIVEQISKDSETGILSLTSLNGLINQNRYAAEKLAQGMGRTLEQLISATKAGVVSIQDVQQATSRTIQSVESDLEKAKAKGLEFGQSYDIIKGKILDLGQESAKFIRADKFLSGVASGEFKNGFVAVGSAISSTAKIIGGEFAGAAGQAGTAIADLATKLGTDFVQAADVAGQSVAKSLGGALDDVSVKIEDIIRKIPGIASALNNVQARDRGAAAGALAGDLLGQAPLSRAADVAAFARSPEFRGGNGIPLPDIAPLGSSPELSGSLKAANEPVVDEIRAIGKTYEVVSDEGTKEQVMVIRGGTETARLSAEAQQRALASLQGYTKSTADAGSDTRKSVDKAADDIVDAIRAAGGSGGGGGGGGASFAQAGDNFYGTARSNNDLTNGTGPAISASQDPRMAGAEDAFGPGNYRTIIGQSFNGAGGTKITADAQVIDPQKAATYQADKLIQKFNDGTATAADTLAKIGTINVNGATVSTSSTAYKDLVAAVQGLTSASTDLTKSTEHISAYGYGGQYGGANPVAVPQSNMTPASTTQNGTTTPTKTATVMNFNTTFNVTPAPDETFGLSDTQTQNLLAQIIQSAA